MVWTIAHGFEGGRIQLEEHCKLNNLVSTLSHFYRVFCTQYSKIEKKNDFRVLSSRKTIFENRNSNISTFDSSMLLVIVSKKSRFVDFQLFVSLKRINLAGVFLTCWVRANLTLKVYRRCA